MTRRPGPFWKERREELRRLWVVERWSSGRIGSEFGVSSSAVMGAIDRAGLMGMGGSYNMPAKSKSKPKRARVDFARKGWRPPARPAPAPIPDAIPAKAGAGIGKVALFDLKWHHCRWPFGDAHEGGVMFCGDDKADGLPYCRHHSAVAFQPGARRS